MIKLTLLCLIMLYSVTTVFVRAQQVNPSSEGLAVIRNIQTPVDYSTGTASVNVPLYNLDAGGIQVPITLSNSASGIKAHDRASYVGMGWKLNAGGRITRLVKKHPDERGLVTGSPATLYTRFFSSVNSKYKYYNELDAEYDIYYFEIPGASGMFVCGSNNEGITIPHQSDITINKRSDNNSWVIKKRDGTSYFFGNSDLSREQTTLVSQNSNIKTGSETFTYVSSWLLSNISTYDGQSVLFQYQAAKEQVINDINYVYTYEYIERPLGEKSFEEKSVDENKNVITTQPKVISSISDNRQTLKFTYDSYYDKIFFIDVITLGTNRYRIKLSYNHSPSRSDDRYLLKNIEYVSGSEVMPICSFNYFLNPANRPPERITTYDHWGYYNSSDINASHRPKNKWFTQNGEASREPHLDNAIAGTLTGITYPGGGGIPYEFEWNTVRDGNSSNKTVGGLRIKKITETDGAGRTGSTSFIYEKNGYSTGTRMYPPIDSQRYTYNTTSGHNASITYYITLYSRPINFINDISGRSVIYSYVKVVNKDNSYTEYEFTTKNDEGCDDEINYVYGATNNRDRYDAVMRNTDGNSSLVNYFPKDSRFWRRGLLKSVSQFDNNSLLVKKEDYKYDFKDVGELKSYIPIYKDESLKGATFKHYMICESGLKSEAVLLTEKNVYQSEYALPSTTRYTYNNKHRLVSIEETVGSDIYKTTYKFISDYINYPSAYRILLNAGVDIPLETVNYKNNKVVGATLSTYKTLTIELGLGSIDLKAVPEGIYSIKTSVPLSTFTPSGTAGVVVADPNYSLDLEYKNYNPNLKLLQTEAPGGIKTSYLYGRNDTEVIAEINNAENMYPPLSEETGRLDSYGWSSHAILNFSLGFRQEVKFDYSVLWMESDYSEDLRFEIRRQDGTYVAEYYTSENDTRWAYELDAGNYYFSASSVDPYADPEVLVFSEVVLHYKKSAPGRSQVSEVYYNGFEFAGGSAVPAGGYAKTGKLAYNGRYTINNHNLKPGSYVLTYWQSTNSCRTWQKVSQRVTVTNGWTYTIGVNGSWVDEVRIIPADARITTYSHEPGVGKTSETDHNGNTTYWQYDNFGRLVQVLDNDRNPVSSYRYNVPQL